MIRRCVDQKRKSYKDYGGRGIKVCERWLTSFENFYADMGDAPSKSHEIERVENNGDYTPENCKWCTHKEQARNRRNNRTLTHDGRTQCLAAWADEMKLNVSTVVMRLNRGWSVFDALTKPLVRGRPSPPTKNDK
jgi:hypothetical protein